MCISCATETITITFKHRAFLLSITTYVYKLKCLYKSVLQYTDVCLSEQHYVYPVSNLKKAEIFNCHQYYYNIKVLNISLPCLVFMQIV